MKSERLGGRKKAAFFLLYNAYAAIGGYAACRTIDWARVDRLVFLCSGNICRSPYGAMKARLWGVTAISYGTSTIDGAPADAQAIESAARRQVSLREHRSTPLGPRVLASGDLVLALEPHHLHLVRPFAKAAGAQATLLGLWRRRPLAYIPDPFGCADTCFQHIFTLIDEALEGVVQRLPGPPNA